MLIGHADLSRTPCRSCRYVIAIGVVAFRSIGLIVASVVNSMQEGVIIIQLLYFVMLFLSGSTFPVTEMPAWLQTVAQFIPAAYLVSGLGSFAPAKAFFQNTALLWARSSSPCSWPPSSPPQIFRWEKGEEDSPAASAWVVAVLLPFFLLGGIQAITKDNVEKAKITERQSGAAPRSFAMHVSSTGDGRCRIWFHPD